MKISDFDYDLADERIAQFPPEVRGQSRLLQLNRETGEIKHRSYQDIVDYLQPGDVVVLNDTKVIKARLIAANSEGKERELLLIEEHGHPTSHNVRKCLYRGKVRSGEILKVGQTKIQVREVLTGGIAEIESSEDLLELADQTGSVPLPPYMHREATAKDTERYQTVFADKAGSVAAPTASLNFTDEIIDNLTTKGVKIAYLTLHVGLGTFMPIRSDQIEEHKMHSEYFEIPPETVALIKKAKLERKRICTVGTTVTRTLEYAADQILHSGTNPKGTNLDDQHGAGEEQTEPYQDFDEGAPEPATQQDANGGLLAGEADIFIYPGYEFKIVDMLLTNFHAPRTTVLMLAATFATWPHLQKAYQEALKEKYNFLSYGDSMLIY